MSGSAPATRHSRPDRPRARARHVLERAGEARGGMCGERDARRPHLAADRGGTGRIATGELRRESTGHHGRPAGPREPEHADHRPLLRGNRRRRVRPWLGRLEQEGLDGRGGRREDPASAERAPDPTRASRRLHCGARRDLEPLSQRAQQRRRTKPHPDLPAGDRDAGVRSRPPRQRRTRARARVAPACERQRPSLGRVPGEDARVAHCKQLRPGERHREEQGQQPEQLESGLPALPERRSRLASQRGHRRHPHPALPGAQQDRQAQLDPHRPAVRALHRHAALQRSRHRAAGRPARAQPYDVSPRRRARCRGAQPERLAHQHELPPDQPGQDQRPAPPPPPPRRPDLIRFESGPLPDGPARRRTGQRAGVTEALLVAPVARPGPEQAVGRQPEQREPDQHAGAARVEQAIGAGEGQDRDRQ